ncbi:hypothetical protein [Sulfuracidifex tepidarius]|uniref:Uncharacterized protein n=1 Tax=Sulfuracidifex tepidarius TaxID=1294262 RepID=A0A510DV26_9CREN|nr:hypothetical protein [Sulfuracidifex tepidarius]BBG24024.1 hypothetical protein IC006_1325 [Sulfuracidifex tepidarius]BBG26779.1 hypothetical protein IC007_1300 [Sulfuracidifex tepidarius]
MKVTETTGKYKVIKNGKELLIEEVKNERGEKIFVLSSLKEVKLNDDNTWTLKEDDAKEIKPKEADANLKPILNKVLAYL